MNELHQTGLVKQGGTIGTEGILGSVVVNEPTLSQEPLVRVVLLSVILLDDEGYEHVSRKSQT